jgi:hypothetical protein
VAERCTCGAELVADARFCHRCGRPLREPDVEEPAAEAVLAQVMAGSLPEVALTAPPPIGWHNGAAVRVALISASLSFAVGLLAGRAGAGALQLFLSFLITAAGGFYSVFLYRRRTSAALSLREGARLGWLTGIFGFVINVILLTFGFVTLSSRGGLASVLKENAAAMSLTPEMTNQMQELLANPVTVAVILFFVVIFLFMTYTLSASLGGVMGAKYLGGEGR